MSLTAIWPSSHASSGGERRWGSQETQFRTRATATCTRSAMRPTGLAQSGALRDFLGRGSEAEQTQDHSGDCRCQVGAHTAHQAGDVGRQACQAADAGRADGPRDVG